MTKKISVPTPLISTAMLGSKPISRGARIVDPNIATTCCRPSAVVCGHGRRSSGATTPPSTGCFTVQLSIVSPSACFSHSEGVIFAWLLDELQILADEIAADVLGIGVDQLLGDRSRDLAVGHRCAVEALDRQDAEARGGQKHLFGVGGVEHVDVA